MSTKRLAPKARWGAAVSHDPGGRTDAARWAEFTDSPLLQEAVQIALAELCMRNKAPDLQTAATVAWKLEGAKQVLDILLNLGEQEKPLLQREETGLTAV